MIFALLNDFKLVAGRNVNWAYFNYFSSKSKSGNLPLKKKISFRSVFILSYISLLKINFAFMCVFCKHFKVDCLFISIQLNSFST